MSEETVNVDPELRASFLGGMSYAAATVNVVTTDGPAGLAGVTVSAMSSVSADTPKPTLLVCVHHLSVAAAAIIENGVFCVNVLRDDQSFISDAFAGRFATDLASKFECASWTTLSTGAPRVIDPLVAFDCKINSSQRVGTHHVLIGEVQEIFLADRGSPLIYANRSYGRTHRIDPVTSIEVGQRAEEKTLRLACFHTFGPFVLPELLSSFFPDAGLTLSLIEGDHRRVLESLRSGEADLALLYDFDLGEDIACETLAELEPYVLLAENHRLAKFDELALEQLAEEDLVLLDAPPSDEYFTGLFTGAGLTPNVKYRSHSIEMIRGLVGRGLGVAVLATRPASNISYDGSRLVTRPIAAKMPPNRIVLASRKTATRPAVADQFAFACREMFEHEA